MSGNGLRDDALKALLRAEAPAPPFDDVDWAGLHARITAGAAPLLRQRGAAWWQYLAGWSRRAATASIAAAALVLLLLAQTVRPAPVTADDTAFRTVEEELADVMVAEGLPLFDGESQDVVDALLFQEAELR